MGRAPEVHVYIVLWSRFQHSHIERELLPIKSKTVIVPWRYKTNLSVIEFKCYKLDVASVRITWICLITIICAASGRRTKYYYLKINFRVSYSIIQNFLAKNMPERIEVNNKCSMSFQTCHLYVRVGTNAKTVVRWLNHSWSFSNDASKWMQTVCLLQNLFFPWNKRI